MFLCCWRDTVGVAYCLDVSRAIVESTLMVDLLEEKIVVERYGEEGVEKLTVLKELRLTRRRGGGQMGAVGQGNRTR